jgi:hypothetical protein
MLRLQNFVPSDIGIGRYVWAGVPYIPANPILCTVSSMFKAISKSYNPITATVVLYSWKRPGVKEN